LARGIRLCIEHPAALNQDFNLSTAVATSVLELSRLIWQKIYDGTKPFRYVSDSPYPYDVQMRSPDVSKADRLLGFRAETSLGEVLDEVIPWIEGQIRVDQISPDLRPGNMQRISASQ
jgi:nucleoside-diphosphate-sugar epimerase